MLAAQLRDLVPMVEEKNRLTKLPHDFHTWAIVHLPMYITHTFTPALRAMMVANDNDISRALGTQTLAGEGHGPCKLHSWKGT